MNSFVRGELFPSLADHVLVHYDQLCCIPSSIKDGDTIYCDTHQINRFKELLITKKNLTIITHNSDGYICDETPWKEHGVNTNDFDGCYTKWYAQNSYSKKDNVIPLPIGFENTKWEQYFGPKTRWLGQVFLEKIEPIYSVYFNCNESTNMVERQNCKNICSQFDFVTISNSSLMYKEYLGAIKLHKFTLSPEGNGLDCHRTWEVLAMQRVPILKKSGALERLYKDLPVLLVDKWEDLSGIDLEHEYNKRKEMFLTIDFLNFGFWKGLITNDRFI